MWFTPHFSRRRAALTLASVATAAVMVPSAAGAAQNPTNPFANHQQFIDCEAGHTSSASNYSPWYHLYRSHGKSRKLLGKIAKVPTVKWFTAAPRDSIRGMSRAAERYIANVDHPAYGGASCTHKLRYSAHQWAAGPVSDAARGKYVGDYPVMAFRALNDKTCGANADPTHTYRKRIDAFVKQLSRTYDSPEGYRYWQKAPPPWAHWRASWRMGAIVLEPDAIGLMGARSKHCIRGAEKTQVLGLMRYAVDKLTAIPGLAVYIDGGAADWLHVDEAVSLLRSAGVAKTRGFTLNASHFDRTTPELAFGNKVAKTLGKHYVLNTAENAHGTLAKKHWNGLPARIATNCNPKNAGLGRQPTSNTGSPYADAFLWISRPGLSSNAGNRCRRGPTTNIWFQGQALLLARQANFHTPSWPPKSF
jgi:hypothetical protein